MASNSVWKLDILPDRNKAKCLQRINRSMVIAMCGVQLKDRERDEDFVLVFGFNEEIELLAMANSVRWHGHVSRSHDGHVLRMVFDLEVEGQKKTERLKSTLKKQGVAALLDVWGEKLGGPRAGV